MAVEALESLRYREGSLEVLDQLKLPHEKEFIPVLDAAAAWSVVRKMQVRGAPLIAIVSALGLAVEAKARLVAGGDHTAASAAAFLRERIAYLRTSRPTAVNLFNAMEELEGMVAEVENVAGTDGSKVYAAYIAAAERMLVDDVAANRSIGDLGAKAILQSMQASGRGDAKARVLTICNTGALACAGWGTALGIIRSLHAQGRLEMAYACETRPYNQGSRLTAFELVEDGIPGTLICDSMAAALMKRSGIDACVVGADRVAANGDTANKIGTYMLSVLARHHGVPLFVASPIATLDVNTLSGDEIPIEERPAEELVSLTVNGAVHRLAAPGINVWNPAFDVTPAALITCIITEEGCVKRTGTDAFDVPGFLKMAPRPSKRLKQ